MSATVAKTKPRRKVKAPQRRRPVARLEPCAVVDASGRTTHVLVPIDEYEQLVKSQMAASAVAAIENPSTDWSDGDAFALKLAGRRIAQARKAAGLTQKQLGDKLGIPQSQVSRIERNPDRTTMRTLKRIAKALNVNIQALV